MLAVNCKLAMNSPHIPNKTKVKQEPAYSFSKKQNTPYKTEAT